MSTRRVLFFDGLRGLAALQVIFDHFIWLFAPGAITTAGVFANGQCAVFLFFLMSGYVLSISFNKPWVPVKILMASRVLRLTIPAVASVVLAAILMLFTQTQIRAAALSVGPGYLSRISDSSHFQSLYTDLSGISLFFGYRETGLVTFPYLASQATSLNPPLWTLNIELWGSIWILTLIVIKRNLYDFYRALLIVSIFLIGVNPLNLFTLGHLCAARPATQSDVKGAILACAGIVICNGHYLGIFNPDVLISLHGFFELYSWFDWQTELGAVLIFLGILRCATLQRCLEMRFPQFLGQISFPIYLVHFPILLFIGCPLMAKNSQIDRDAALGMVLVLSLTFILLFASAFEAFVDKPVLRQSRKIVSKHISADPRTWTTR